VTLTGLMLNEQEGISNTMEKKPTATKLTSSMK